MLISVEIAGYFGSHATQLNLKLQMFLKPPQTVIETVRLGGPAKMPNICSAVNRCQELIQQMIVVVDP